MANSRVSEKPVRSQQTQTTLVAFGAVASVVTVVVMLLTGDIVLGLLYGLVPGLILGALAWFRIARGGLIKPRSSKDRPGPY